MIHRNDPSRRRLLAGAAGLTGGLLVGGLMRPDAAHAAVTPPRVYTRAEWGARRPTGTIRYLDRQPDHIVVHHTAGENTTDYSLAAAFRHSKWIQDLHMDRNGWIDAGQQLTISRGGYIMEGRSLSLRAIIERQHVSGAQTAGTTTTPSASRTRGSMSPRRSRRASSARSCRPAPGSARSTISTLRGDRGPPGLRQHPVPG